MNFNRKKINIISNKSSTALPLLILAKYPSAVFSSKCDNILYDGCALTDAVCADGAVRDCRISANRVSNRLTAYVA